MGGGASDGIEITTGSFTVANTTVINDVQCTNEDAPEPVLIHVPPIIRPDGAIGYHVLQYGN